MLETIDLWSTHAFLAFFYWPKLTVFGRSVASTAVEEFSPRFGRCSPRTKIIRAVWVRVEGWLHRCPGPGAGAFKTQIEKIKLMLFITFSGNSKSIDHLEKSPKKKLVTRTRFPGAPLKTSLEYPNDPKIGSRSSILLYC